MARININEQDTTSSSVVNYTDVIVYVPGFASPTNTNPSLYNTPTLLTTSAELLNQFGNGVTGPMVTDSYKITGDVSSSFLDRSFSMALAILNQGGKVLYEAVQATVDSNGNQDVHYLFDALRGNVTTPSILDKLKDRFNYNVRFITSGGYGSCGYISILTEGSGSTEFQTSVLDGSVKDMTIANKMLEVAARISGTDNETKGRGDCVALIDHSYFTQTELQEVVIDAEGTTAELDVPTLIGNETTVRELFQIVSDTNSVPAFNNESLNKYGAAFTPWWKDTNGELRTPSLAYILAFCTSVANANPNWFAAAGATRGKVPSIATPLIEVGELSAESLMQEGFNSINPICNVSPYGYIIWGNRTMMVNTDGLTASSFLNVRNLCIDIKKTLFIASQRLLFEQNSTILWVNFKALITPLLDRMMTGQGISGYKITRIETNSKSVVKANIQIIPIEAVEEFDITVILTDEITELDEEATI